MALNLGTSGKVDLGSSSGQLLQTGATMAQDRTTELRATAATELQLMKDEAESLGISMRRMAEMQPGRFQSAMSVLMGGGLNGKKAAEENYRQVMAGPESPDQFENWNFLKLTKQFENSGQPFIKGDGTALPPQAVNALFEDQGGQAQEPTAKTVEGTPELVKTDRLGGEIPEGVIKSLENDPVAYYKNSLGSSDPQDRRYAAILTDDGYLEELKSWVASSNTELGESFKKRLDNAQEGTVEYWNTMADIMSVSLNNPEGVVKETDGSDSLKSTDAYMAFLEDNASFKPNRSLNDSQAQRDHRDRYAKLTPEDKAKVITYLQNKDAIEGQTKFDPSWGLEPNFKERLRANNFLIVEELPIPPGGSTPAGPPLPRPATLGEKEVTKPEPIPEPPPEPRPGQTPMDWFDERKRWENRVEESGVETGTLRSDMNNARLQTAETKQKVANAEFLEAQTAGKYADIEIGYATMNANLGSAGAEAGLSDEDIKFAQDRWDEYSQRLYDLGVGVPPYDPRTGMQQNSDVITDWANDKFKSQEDVDAYINATASIMAAHGTNDLLQSQMDVVSVPVKTGLFNWGKTRMVPVLVPKVKPTGANFQIMIDGT